MIISYWKNKALDLQMTTTSATIRDLEATIRIQELEIARLKAQVASLMSAAYQIVDIPDDDYDALKQRLPELSEPQTAKPSKKTRGPNRVADADTRCQGLVLAVEMDANGQLVPKQCKKSACGDGRFCKQHSGTEEGECTKCKSLGLPTVCHQFAHEHCGTVSDPNTNVFKLSHDALQKAYNKKHGIVDVAKPKRKKRSDTGTKRALNPYMMFLAVNRDQVKRELLAENPLLKGKALATAITCKVGEMWNSSKREQVDDDNETGSQYSEHFEFDDEEEVCLVYNQRLKCWIDESTDLCYGSADAVEKEEFPIGQLVNGKVVEF